MRKMMILQDNLLLIFDSEMNYYYRERLRKGPFFFYQARRDYRHGGPIGRGQDDTDQGDQGAH